MSVARLTAAGCPNAVATEVMAKLPKDVSVDQVEALAKLPGFHWEALPKLLADLKAQAGLGVILADFIALFAP